MANSIIMNDTKSPIKVLFDEHEIIISAIQIAKKADKLLDKDKVAYEQVIRDLINFFRSYADQYHHNKEENILFPLMSKKNEFLEDGVLKEMFDNHADFRSMIKSIEMFLDGKDYNEAQHQLNIYGEALLDHIAVENDEVFQMAETLLNKEELEKMYFNFEDCDRELGGAKKSQLAEQLKEIQNKL